MKAIISSAVAVVSLAGSIALSDCVAYEAQFIGKVTEINKVVGENGTLDCTVKIGEFRFFQENMLCPLDESTASSVLAPARSCDLKVGEEVSGILSVDNDGRVKW